MAQTDWLCRRTSDYTIDVLFRGNSVGQYNLLQQPYCEFCACPGITTESCTSKRNHSYDGFDKICAMGIYYKSSLQKPDLLSEHIIELKSDVEFAKPIGLAMAITVRDIYPELLNSELLVPVASHPHEVEERGYNQAFALAKIIGESLNLTLEDVLIKTRSEKMPKRGWWERREAARGLYQIKEASTKIIGKNILLVDDVVTTGATSSECATLLSAQAS